MDDEEVAFLKKAHCWEEPSAKIFGIQCEDESEDSFYRHPHTILHLLDPKSHEVGLNIGCGCGRIEWQFAHQVKEFHGVDFSGSAIDYANKHRRENAFFHQNDGRTLPFLDNTFDFVMSETTFQHVPVSIVRSYIIEAHRVLKPGGRCLVQIPKLGTYESDNVCGAMTEDEVAEALSMFSLRRDPPQPLPHYYFTPMAIK